MQYIVACEVSGFRYFPILKIDLCITLITVFFLLNHAVAADFVHI